MPGARFAVPCIKALVSPTAVVILGAVIVSVLICHDEESHDERAGSPRADRVLTNKGGEDDHVTMLVAKGSPGSNLVIHRAGGEPAVRLRLLHDGAVFFEPTGSPKLQFVVYRSAVGSAYISMKNGDIALSLATQADGSAEMSATHGRGSAVHGIHVTKEGDIRHQESLPIP